MGYFIQRDYDRLIQDVSLQQVMSGNIRIRTDAEASAIEEAKSYLRAKYNVDAEFSNTGLYNPQAAYGASDRVYLDAPLYNQTKTYSVGELVTYKSSIYQCDTEVSVAESFDEDKWQYLGDYYDIFYAVLPNEQFDFKRNYEKEDIVFYKGHRYECLIETASITHDVLIQFNSTWSIPYVNIFPDDKKSGDKFWKDLGAYIVEAGSITDSDVWKKGDNRNQQMVMYVLDMVIYHLYRRIPPSVVPEIRILAYQTAVSWFNKVAKGEDVVASIEKNQPASGGRIRHGSRPKLNNFY